ncbi:MAG: outer membrane beta-barrel protein [Xanthobacteraceae bacterium]
MTVDGPRPHRLCRRSLHALCHRRCGVRRYPGLDTGFAAASSTNAGWTLGGGLEGAITQNWTAKVEYLYVDLGKFNCGLNCGAGLVNDNVSFHTNILRAGVNYRFY